MASADMHLRFAARRRGQAVGRSGRSRRRRARWSSIPRWRRHTWPGRPWRGRPTSTGRVTLEESAQALELNPNLDLARYFRAAAFYHLGLLERAARRWPRRFRRPPEPRRAAAHGRRGRAFSGGREAPKRSATSRRHATPAAAAYADSYLSQAYFYAGDTTRALQMLDSLSASTSTPASASAARHRWRASSPSAATAARADRLIARVLAAGYMDHHVAYSLGAAYAQLGRMEEARRGSTGRSAAGFPCYPWYVRDPLLEPLRRDPASHEFLERLRAQWERREGALRLTPRQQRLGGPPPASEGAMHRRVAPLLRHRLTREEQRPDAPAARAPPAPRSRPRRRSCTRRRRRIGAQSCE